MNVYTIDTHFYELVGNTNSSLKSKVRKIEKYEKQDEYVHYNCIFFPNCTFFIFNNLTPYSANIKF